MLLARASPPSLPPPAGPPAPAAVTRCLTALRKRPGQPPASAWRLRLKRLRAARPFPGSRAPGQLPLTVLGRPPAGGREEAGGAGGCVLPDGRAARREEPLPPPPGATWRAPGRERQGSGGGLPGGFAAQGGRRVLPRPAGSHRCRSLSFPPACPGFLPSRPPRPHPIHSSRRPGALRAAGAAPGSPGPLASCLMSHPAIPRRLPSASPGLEASGGLAHISQTLHTFLPTSSTL